MYPIKEQHHPSTIAYQVQLIQDLVIQLNILREQVESSPYNLL